MMQQITITKPKRGAKRANASVVDAFAIISKLDVSADLPSLTVRQYPQYEVSIVEDERVEVRIPSVIFPLGETDPVEFHQTLTSCGSTRPVMNRDDVSTSFFTHLYNGQTAAVDLSTPHAVLIAPLKGRRGILVVPEEHEHAANVINRVRDLLPTKDGQPFVVRNTVIVGDGMWTRSQWHLSSSLFELIFEGCDAVLSRAGAFYKPVVRKNRAAAPANSNTTRVTGTIRRRDGDDNDGGSGSTQAVPTPPQRRSKPPRVPVGMGKGLMTPVQPATAQSTERGMSTEVSNRMLVQSIIRAVTDDHLSDMHDVVYASAAITTARSHLDNDDFVEFMRHLSMVETDPLVAHPRPAEAVSDAITDVVRHYDESIVDALNMLADHM